MQIKLFPLLLALLLLSGASCGYVAPMYAEWAHSHVVWVNGREQNQDKLIKMVQQYEKNNIKVGGLLIDSAWSTGFNNFEWDLKKFPHPQQLVDDMHAKGIRVLLWATSMINNDTEIYAHAKANNFLLNAGKVHKWWHGYGGFLDYLNPKAVQWWHSLLDKVLSIGIDGFKCDGTDPISFLMKPWPYSPHSRRAYWGHEYGHRYYGDFYNYTKSRNPEGLIMARPTDTFQTYASWNYAPRNVMFSGWVGDQDSSTDGFRKAMYNVLKSAWSGYLGFGFDIGGYRGQNIPRNIFIRWVQVGALVPFMENGGNGKHQPWLFDQETVGIYRDFVNLHYKLKTTFLSLAQQNYSKKKSFIKPLARKIGQDSARLPDTYCYLLCDNLLVAPIFEVNGQAEVVFPRGSNWFYYFDHSKVFKGDSRGYFTFPINETGLFVRADSIIPFSDQILLVAVRDGTTANKTLIHGDFTDYLSISYVGGRISTRVQRFYKQGRQLDSETPEFVNIRLIGYRAERDVFQVQVNQATETSFMAQLEQVTRFTVLEGEHLVKQE